MRAVGHVARGACAIAVTALVGSAIAMPAAAVTARPAAVTALPGVLSGVAATSAGNAWAVGSSNGGQALIVHWTGASWKQEASPAPKGSALNGVAALSGTDAWAVGSSGSDRGTDHSETLVLHLVGGSWQQTPSPGPKGSVLYSVTAVSASDAWAVGTSYSAGASRAKTLVLHWNGASWKQVPSPSPKIISSLSGVVAVSAGNAWAVGSTTNVVAGVSVHGDVAGPQSLLLHWNGKVWNQVTGHGAGLSAVAVLSARSIWAAGSTSNARSLALHWNGATWKQVPSPGPGAGGPSTDGPHGVAVASARSAWIVGNSFAFPATFKAIVLRWNGSAWKEVSSPAAAGSVLTGVTTTSPTSAWAVGWNGTISHRTLILRWNGATWTRQ